MCHRPVALQTSSVAGTATTIVSLCTSMPTNRVDCSMTRPPVPEAPRQTIRRDPRSSTHRDDGSPLQAGYGHEVCARVSTGGQSAQRQVDELRKAGCDEILEETSSGADRS